MTGWTIDQNGGDGWAAASDIVHSGSYSFATSYSWDTRHQTIDLVAAGFSAADLDGAPTIAISEWMATRSDCGGQYYLNFELLDASQQVITSWADGSQSFPNTLDANTAWFQVAYSFSGYGAGVRYVRFEDGGWDDRGWAGDYGTHFDDAIVVVSSFAGPSITSQPESQSVTSGDSASLSVTATGAAPLSYQWWDNGAEISGATNASFSLDDALMSDAGSYTVVVTNTYGSVTSSVAVLTVNQATPVVSAWPVAGAITYPQALSASTLVGGSASVDGTFAFNDATAILNADTNYVLVVFTPIDTADYTTVTGSVAVVVAQGLVEITVLPTASPITYGQSLASSTLSGGNATVDGSFSFADSSVTPASAGIYSAVVWFTATNTNYSVFTTNIAITVNKAVASLVLSGTNQNYDGTPKSVTATTTPAGLTVDVTYNGSSTPPTIAGSYAVVATIDDTNYAGTATGTLVVSEIPLLVAAQNVTNSYGVTNAPFTAAITGFVNGESVSNLSGTLTFTVEDTNNDVVSVDTNTAAGTYTIIPGGLTSSNYTITYTNGALIILPAILTVTADSLTNIYGSPLPPLTWSCQGFMNGEDTNVLSGAPSLSANLSSGSPVAGSPYPIIITNGTLSASNYTFTFVDGTFTVLPASLTVSADNATNVYGSPMPALTGSMVGVTNNDPLTVSFTTVATQGSSVGTYDILPVFNEPDLLANYAVTTNTGTFTVSPALLTATADNQTRAYGQTNTVFSVSYSGFVNGQDSSIVTGPIAFSCMDTNNCPVGTNTPVGVYCVHVTTPQTAPNYSIGYADGTLTVTQTVLTVSADPQSRLYGQTNPVLTVTYSGFVNGEGTNVISGQPGLSTAASLASPVGAYDIVVGPGSLSATNYSFSLTNGILTVGKALLTVTADNQSRLYGQTNPVLTVSYNGFVDGDTESVLSGAAALSTIADTNTPVGNYNIVVTNGTLTATDYALSFVNGTLAIGPAPLSITANDATRQYGTTNPVFTVTMLGFVNGQDATALGGTLSVTTSADQTSSVGTYDIVPSGLSSSNYALNCTNGTLTVTQAPLTVMANSAVRQYGTTNPVFGGTITGLLNGDPITVNYNCGATQSSPAGSYAIVPSLNDPEDKAPNYAVTTQNGTLTITVAVIPTPAPILYVVGSPPMFIDTNASVADGGGLNFNGASLSITIITNATPDDELGVEPQGNGAGQIGVQATNVTYGGAPFATYSGGDDLNPLVFLFNTNANAQSVTALMRRLTFATESTNTNYCVIQASLSVGGNTVVAQYVFTLDRPPVASDDVIMAAQGETIQIPFCQVLTNVCDLDGHVLTITDCSDVSANGGWVSINSTAFTYTPPAGVAGQDRFAYVVEDGRGGDCVGVVVINFVPKNVLSINTCNLGTTGAELTMAGVPGQVYQIQASTDLVNWTTLNTVTADWTGVIQILDAAATNYPNRFYRAVWQ